MGGWYIDKSICDKLIKYFNKNKHLQSKGRTIKGVNLEEKDSLDISIEHNREDIPFYNYRIELQKVLDNYCKKYSFLQDYTPFNIISSYNIQYYKPKQGFKMWHAERQSFLTTKRLLVFMTYLNDVSDGGTEFFYQKLIVPAKKGLTIIWPSDWTHVHKGQISDKHEKYIITGWYELVG